MRERLYIRLLWAVITTTLACGSSGPSGPSPGPAPEAGATGGAGGGSGTPVPADDGAVVVMPGERVDGAVVVPPSPDAEGLADATVTPAPTAPLGPFPLEAVKAARPAAYVSAGTHLEGPSWRNGELFFAADGGGWGLMRVDVDRKVYRYHPKLTPVGTYLLADGSLLACDHNYFLVQVFADGKVAVLPHDGIAEQFCNDVAVDGTGNIFVTARRNGSVFRISPAGAVTKVAGGLNAPNGVEVDPQNKYLYIGAGAGGGGKILRFAMPADGASFGQPEMVGNAGQPDGMAFDAWGNLWVAAWSAGQVVIFSPDKTVLATIPVGGAINLTFGGKDGDTVFVEEDGRGVYKLGPIPGLRGFLHPGAPKYQIKQMLDLVPANTPVQ
jgi:gluconolactonase